MVRGPVSPARAWRPAVVARLARTLGRKDQLLRFATTVNTRRPKISLRPATEADALCLGVLATQVFLDTYAIKGITETVANEVREAFSTDAFARILDGISTFITVAVHENALVGFAQTTIGTIQPLAPSGLPAEIDRLYVQEPFTNHGIGSRLPQVLHGYAAGGFRCRDW